MARLNNDVVTEILLRLPVKSAARSQCVSKHWRATISDDYVRRRLAPHLSLVYFPDAGKAASPRFASASAASSTGLLEDRDLGDLFSFLDGAVACDASNGLLLLRSASASAAGRFFVADPVARRWAALPPPPTDAMLSTLAFDPSSGPSPSYRVINFTGWRGRVGELEVFSSETGKWARREADFGVMAGSLSGSMHLHAGAVYVLAFEPDCIVRMDVSVAGAGEEKVACETIELPEPTDGDGPVTHSGGLLHYVTSDRDRFNVWALDEAASDRQWKLKHFVKVDDVVEEGCGSRAGEIRFLAMHPDKDVAYLWYPWKVVEYDMARKEITGTWEFGEKDQKNRVFKTWLVPSSFYLSDCLAHDGRIMQC
ncbi:hypothetical protein QOZ80_8BG0666770 [Eleusine coracana subsp. coracana]|nr:hypothetical protein QOZ80_8BG0666770 [Eleusine coracana subsp. coracana]